MNSQGFGGVGRTRQLTQWLIISCTLNVGFLATFGYILFRDRSSSLEETKLTAKALPISLSNEQLLETLSHNSFSETIPLLQDEHAMEEGFKKRDLALGALVHFHGFNLEKALGGVHPEKRAVALKGEEGTQVIFLFPGLGEFEFKAIVDFIRTETWPLTTRGLFLKAQTATAKGRAIDESLLEAFTMTPEFLAVTTLFTRAKMDLKKEEIAQLLLQGNFDLFHSFSLQQKLSSKEAVPQESLRELLVGYLDAGAKKSAQLLLQSQMEFALKKLSDEQIEKCFELLEGNAVELQKLSLELLVSRRCDKIREKAAEKLYSLAKELAPRPFNYELALARFAPDYLALEEGRSSQTAAITEVVAAEPHIKVYTVESGDNLWKIGRKFSISAERIKVENKLKNDKLKPGQQIFIPDE